MGQFWDRTVWDGTFLTWDSFVMRQFCGWTVLRSVSFGVGQFWYGSVLVWDSFGIGQFRDGKF